MLNSFNNFSSKLKLSNNYLFTHQPLTQFQLYIHVYRYTHSTCLIQAPVLQQAPGKISFKVGHSTQLIGAIERLF